MNQQDIFASAQVVTMNPILEEDATLRHLYYAYLKKLIRLSKWGRRKYIKAQLSFYKNTLCGESSYEKSPVEWDAMYRYCYLIPFDIAAILAYRKNSIKPDTLSSFILQIISDFELPREAEGFLDLEFSAALGNKQAWDDIVQDGRLKHFTEYLQLVKSNIFFIRERPYNILITATMSAGKSTLINALVGKNISLMQNMAATSKIHTIISKPFDDGVTTEYDAEISLDATKEELLTDNNENQTSRILVSTYFNGPLGGQRLMFFDSPGVNSSEHQDHAEITKKMIRAKKYKALLYVLNATQLGTNDDEQHLRLVAKMLGRSKIVFVMNKIDNLIAENESLLDVVRRQKDFLIAAGFRNPVICPVSARAAYLVKKSKQEPLSRLESWEMESYKGKFAKAGLSDYYEHGLGCVAIPHSDNESEMLYKNCGFVYLENIINHIKNGGTIYDTSIR